MRKIAIKLHDKPGRPVQPSAESSEEGLSLAEPMAAATSATISMEMRWMSAILYDKISPHKKIIKPPQALQSLRVFQKKTCFMFHKFAIKSAMLYLKCLIILLAVLQQKFRQIFLCLPIFHFKYIFRQRELLQSKLLEYEPASSLLYRLSVS